MERFGWGKGEEKMISGFKYIFISKINKSCRYFISFPYIKFPRQSLLFQVKLYFIIAANLVISHDV